ncbi:unnamed protein product [Cuscuta epithymum]|uniref:Tf2-1-like SH3-like domain-containing protein n=1 Tax=Cuscuta epithymum TaxID=186058 RepID=A0AAV0DDY8_9ASTE|nr:unnamed protein product [Cuscuta epithymum]
MIQLLKLHLQRAQNRMNMWADKKRSERMFNIGDWVWLKLESYRQTIVEYRWNDKLAPKFYGPFQISQTVGKVAYQLKLPAEAKIHNTFHVSQLKEFKGILPAKPHIPTWLHNIDKESTLKPWAVLARQMVKARNQAKIKFLIQ